MEFNIKVSYDETRDSVIITSKDKLIPDEFPDNRLDLSGNGGRVAERLLREMLEDSGHITEKHFIPTKLAYEDLRKSPRHWDRITLGKAGGTRTATWALKESGSLLISGEMGSGKSFIEHNIIYHCLQHPKKWRVYAVDPYMSELTTYKECSPVIESVVTKLEDAVELCRRLEKEMRERHKRMEEHGVKNYQDLPNVPHPIMFIFGEFYGFLALSGRESEWGRAEDKLKSEAFTLLNKLSRGGHDAGINLVLSSYDQSKEAISSVYTAGKIVMGRVDASDSQIIVGNDGASRIHGENVGRGYIQSTGWAHGYEFQAAHPPREWFEKYNQRYVLRRSSKQ